MDLAWTQPSAWGPMTARRYGLSQDLSIGLSALANVQESYTPLVQLTAGLTVGAGLQDTALGMLVAQTGLLTSIIFSIASNTGLSISLQLSALAILQELVRQLHPEVLVRLTHERWQQGRN